MDPRIDELFTRIRKLESSIKDLWKYTHEISTMDNEDIKELQKKMEAVEWREAKRVERNQLERKRK